MPFIPRASSSSWRVNEDARRDLAFPHDPEAQTLVEAARRLAAWRDDFLAAGKQCLKSQRADHSPDDRALRQAERKIGQLTMEDEVLRAATEENVFS